MNTELQSYLRQYEPGPVVDVDWGNGIRLRVTSYLVDTLPPDALISSVRCIVLRSQEILVIEDPDGSQYINPGGRREEGESIMETLERELLEETGWVIANPKIFGLLHFHHLNAKPAGYVYPYPDFVHPIYLAQALSYHPDRMQQDDYVATSRFVPVSESASLKLSAGEAMFLNAILDGKTGS